MGFSLRCPFCRGKFSWKPNEGFPDVCELCGETVGHDPDADDVVMPFVRNHGMVKSVDQVYRQMEAGSITRAQIAADMVGAPVSEMSSLKITNLRDNQRPGDTGVVMDSSPVTELMKAHPDRYGFGAPGGVEYSQNVQTGPHPNAGAKMRTMLQDHHGARVGGHAVSDRPANETMQPGYRRRG
jgi:hypothetical protein